MKVLAKYQHYIITGYLCVLIDNKSHYFMGWFIVGFIEGLPQPFVYKWFDIINLGWSIDRHLGRRRLRSIVAFYSYYTSNLGQHLKCPFHELLATP